jgi:hypothetical protein
LQDLAGLSRRTIIFNFFCTLIIFLYLFDSEHTSVLILGSMFVSLCIDLWKVGVGLKSWLLFSC